MDVMYLDDAVQQALRNDELPVNGIAEVWSVPRVASVAKEHGLSAGWSLDLLTGWDFDRPKMRAEKFLPCGFGGHAWVV